jgi:hypothetical protein
MFWALDMPGRRIYRADWFSEDTLAGPAIQCIVFVVVSDEDDDDDDDDDGGGEDGDMMRMRMMMVVVRLPRRLVLRGHTRGARHTVHRLRRGERWGGRRRRMTRSMSDDQPEES